MERGTSQREREKATHELVELALELLGVLDEVVDLLVDLVLLLAARLDQARERLDARRERPIDLLELRHLVLDADLVLARGLVRRVHLLVLGKLDDDLDDGAVLLEALALLERAHLLLGLGLLGLLAREDFAQAGDLLRAVGERGRATKSAPPHGPRRRQRRQGRCRGREGEGTTHDLRLLEVLVLGDEDLVPLGEVLVAGGVLRLAQELGRRHHGERGDAVLR